MKIERHSKGPIPLAITMALFFLSGFSTVLNSILIPYLQQVMEASYTLVSAVPASFYLAYFLFSPVTALLMKRYPLTKVMRVGITQAAAAALLIAYSASALFFPLILLGIFLLGGGIAITQVTGNPFVAALGPLETSSKRMVLVHGVTALGMIFAPLVGSHTILMELHGAMQIGLSPLTVTYVALATAWVVIYRLSFALPEAEREEEALKGGSLSALAKDPFLLLGTLAIATGVGIEVTSASFMVKYLSSSRILDLPLSGAGRWSTMFWLAFTAGRFLATLLLSHMREEKLLLLHALMGIFFGALAMASRGALGASAVVGLGFATSVLFPIAFSITLKLSKSPHRNISAALCMANIGGALYPILQSGLADSYGIHLSYAIPMCGFLAIAAYLAAIALLSKRRRLSLEVEG